MSPYGDCTGFRGNKVVKFRFSPPYGDSTPTYVRFLVAEHVFAPLRGWYLQVPHKHGDQRVFAPLRGWYHLPASGTAERLVFAPLRGLYRTNFCKSKVQSVFAPLWGWYCLPEYTSALRFSFRPLTGMVHGFYLMDSAPQGFRPLTGMVHGDDWYFLADTGFRPLMGMVPATINQLRQAIRFSSPCGDKLKFRKNGFTLDHVRFPSPCGAAPLYHGGGTIEIPFQGEP